jgi:hypothetical protein
MRVAVEGDGQRHGARRRRRARRRRARPARVAVGESAARRPSPRASALGDPEMDAGVDDLRL